MSEAAKGRLPQCERLVTLLSVLGLAALAWVYLWREAVHMNAMPVSGSMDGGAMALAWSLEPLLLLFLMWTIMMVGMMLPSALPAILLYDSLAKKKQRQGPVVGPAWSFVGGYLAAWTGFSLGATFLQAGLQEAKLLTPMMVSGSSWLNGGVLIVAGVYQWLPLKNACLEKCRAPLQFFLFHWRPGTVGAFRMGLEHGTFCVGCCWALMLLLFVAGVMNLLWVALIAGLVLIEKLFPRGRLVGRLAGAGMVAAGAYLILAIG